MLVRDIGPPDARIMFIGEAPGRKEVSAGVPFVGASGSVLKQMCTHAGIEWKDCYVTNLLDHRPKRGDFGGLYEDKKRHKPTPELLKVWEKVREKIRSVKPRVVVTLGAEALRAVTGRRGIKEWRGCPLLFETTPIIPTYHPANVLAQYEQLPVCELDLAKAKRWSKTESRGSQTSIAWEIIREPKLPDVIDWLDGCHGKVVAFDLESIGRTVRCLGFARDKTSICIPFLKLKSYNPSGIKGSSIVSIGATAGPSTSSYWSPEDELVVIAKINEVLNADDVIKVGQNSIGFDQPFLEREFGFMFTNHSFDCMHGFHLLYPELPKSLSFLCSILTDYPNYWSDKDTKDDMSEWLYNCWDTIVTLDAYHIISKDLEESGLMDFYKTKLHPLAVALARCQERGVKIDVDVREKLATFYIDLAKKRLSEAQSLSHWDSLNLDSPKQLKDLIFGDMKCKRVLNKDGKVSTNEECLKKLTKMYPAEPIFGKIIEYRKAKKFLNFLTTTINDKGRMQTSFNASGTKTGRIASSKTIWGTGMNLMNIPKSIRHMFVAPEGRSFVKEDLSQAETRVVAELLKRHGDPTLWELYQDPTFDIHSWLASSIFQKPEADIVKFERQVGKLGNHSGNYRAGPKVLETTATKLGIPGITYEFSKEILRVRGEILPGLEKWWKWIEEELARTRVLTTCLGRRRIFFGRLDHATFRDATSYEPQSIVGDANNIIFTGLDRELDSDCFPVLQVHDEVVVECPDEKIQHTIDTMNRVGHIELWVNPDQPLVIPMDIEVGKDWQNCLEI